jgi:hypothetical protein
MDASTHERRKALLVDFLVKMHIEQTTNVRHLENQRSIATNIFAVIATAVLVVIGRRWIPGVGLSRGDLPLTLGVVALSIAGAFLAMKLFERSRINHDLAEAYRETAQHILSDDMVRVLGQLEGQQFNSEAGGENSEEVLSEDLKNRARERVRSLPYIKSILRFVEAPKENKPYEVTFVRNTKVYKPVSPQEYREKIGTYDPIDPREVIVPRHNARATWLLVPWVKIDTHKTWVIVHVAYGIVGLILTGVAAID